MVKSPPVAWLPIPSLWSYCIHATRKETTMKNRIRRIRKIRRLTRVHGW
jgi:hypothetical protein